MEDEHIKTYEGKDEFLSTVAHQMGTSLTAMKWTLQELQESPAVISDKESKEYVDNMIISNERLIRLARNLLHVARIKATAEDVTYDFQDIDLEPVVTHIIKTLSPLAKSKSVALKAVPFEKPITVRADKDTLILIIENLVDNAIKYSEKKPNAQVVVIVEEKDGNALIKVTDNGIGIADADKKHIFEKFFRAQNVEDHKIKGTGLGLFIVKKMAERHGGTLSFESVEGGGTTFLVTLPTSK